MQAPPGQARPANLQKSQQSIFRLPKVRASRQSPKVSETPERFQRKHARLGSEVGVQLIRQQPSDSFVSRIPDYSRLALDTCLGCSASDSLVVHHRVLQILDPGLSITSSRFLEILATYKARRTEAWFTRKKVAQSTDREKQKKL